jgi:hypothetical protein
MLLGIYKNVAELEEALTLPELELIVKSSRDKEHRLMRFYGFFKGVDIDEGNGQSAKERFEAVQRRAEAKLAGRTDEEIAQEGALSFEDFGFEVESE